MFITSVKVMEASNQTLKCLCVFFVLPFYFLSGLEYRHKKTYNYFDGVGSDRALSLTIMCYFCTEIFSKFFYLLWVEPMM